MDRIPSQVLQPYYNYFTSEMFPVNQNKCFPQTFTFPAPLDTVPLFQRGRHIDPITLVIALDKAGKSTGTLYLDNGESFDHKRGQFLYKIFLIKQQGPDSFTLSSSDAVSQALKSTHQALRSSLTQYQLENSWIKKIGMNIEKIIILGFPSRPTCAKVGGRSNGLHYKYSIGLVLGEVGVELI
ncbi:uncharacterized protein VP01_4667g2 [Puccinia sorghi]|uniref:DUF5110 domain-containing protein n=1 Tax=Puccinia sorghi TaxID=27349 RepID=A0A0L6UN58_9BASI|nr:uncharacterized protein VP01_4667g2 [Puccinia sorghi]